MHPSFLDDSDYRPMGKPETVVELDGGREIAVGLLVPRPFGPGTDAMLEIHAIKGDGNDGGTIKLAITNQIRVAHPRRRLKGKAYNRAMDMSLLSNPRRRDDIDDNGANDIDDEEAG